MCKVLVFGSIFVFWHLHIRKKDRIQLLKLNSKQVHEFENMIEVGSANKSLVTFSAPATPEKNSLPPKFPPVKITVDELSPEAKDRIKAPRARLEGYSESEMLSSFLNSSEFDKGVLRIISFECVDGILSFSRTSVEVWGFSTIALKVLHVIGLGVMLLIFLVTAVLYT